MNKHLVMIDQLEILDSNTKLLSSGSLAIHTGAAFAIFGPGGSGKSLLLQFLYGVRHDGLAYQFSSFQSTPGLIYFLDRNKEKRGHPEIPSKSYDLYLIDEPENGFSIEEFTTFRQKIREENSTLVFVTHHLGFLEHFADEIMVLKYGESKGVFTKDSFFNNEDPYIDYLSKMGC